MLLIAWTVLGSMALLFVNALQHRRSAVQLTADEAALLSRLAAAQQERVITVARLLLEGLSRHEVTGVAPALPGDAPRGVVSAIATVTPRGRIVTSTDPREVGMDVSNAEWFRRAAERRRFVVGSTYEKSGDSISTLRCAQPVLTRGGDVRAVVVASLDIARLCRAELPANFDDNTTFMLVDRSGVVVAPAGRPAGRRDSTVILERTAETKPWRQRVRGGDGRWRVVAFTPRDGASHGLYVGVSVDPAPLLRRADRELATSIALLALLGLAVALVAWRGARLIVLRRVEAMHAMAQRVRAGDLNARTGLPYGEGELSDLSRALDSMASTLQNSVAEHERANGRVRLSEGRTRAVLEASVDGIFLVDRAGRIVECNGAARRMVAGGTGAERSAGRLRGMAIEALLGGPLPEPTAPRWLERTLPRADGGELPVEIVLTPAGHLAAEGLVVATVRDITERRRWQRSLEALSLTDELTGLHNRRGFMSFGNQQLLLSARTGSGAVLFSLDVDGLKEINDAHGHSEGDRALRELADVLRASFRETDVIGRLGGDEFVVLATVHGPNGVRRALERLAGVLVQRNAAGDLRWLLKASVGWARSRPGAEDSLTELLARADRSMYRRKRARGVARGHDAAPTPAVASARPPLVA
jgi:diguanylate cyclase (GGDEF)-like protein/PAS domain S-box-containing protein